MSSVPAELSSSLSDFRTKFVPIGDFLRTTMIGDAKAAAAAEKEKEKTARCSSLPRAECLLRELQEEMRRIDHAKIQLPLCMLLLNDAMMVVKESVKREKPVLVLEEFIPLKKDEECKGEDDGGEERMVKAERDSCKDKKSWMSSVQLWSSDDTRQKVNKKVDRCGNEDAFSASTKNWTPLSLPIKNVAKLSSSTKEEIRREDDLTAPSLSLQTPGMKNLSDQESGSIGSQVTSSAPNSQSSSHKGGPILPLQPCRKQRRCWSPELHRRFVNALQQLGGSQAATPKQIREIMQVDGLTNDEVKSHLQKYRLHTRRMAPAGTAPGNQSLVVLGGLWMSQEQYAESSKAASSQSGSPPGPLEFGTTLMDEEDEEEDDAKSENYGWKSLAPRSGV